MKSAELQPARGWAAQGGESSRPIDAIWAVQGGRAAGQQKQSGRRREGRAAGQEGAAQGKRCRGLRQAAAGGGWSRKQGLLRELGQRRGEGTRPA
jgi:hypothetical protein